MKIDIEEYEKQFDTILDGKNQNEPYDTDEYFNFVRLNKSRIKRWNKVGKITPELNETLKSIDEPLEWILITEPWCGDAAHAHVFIRKLAEINSKINLVFQNRDSCNSEIDNYLTNGSKSIPKLIVRDNNGNDLFTWGPRPKEAQEIHIKNKNNNNLSIEEKKIELQNWYNKDKGASIQNELKELLKTIPNSD